MVFNYLDILPDDMVNMILEKNADIIEKEIEKLENDFILFKMINTQKAEEEAEARINDGYYGNLYDPYNYNYDTEEYENHAYLYENPYNSEEEEEEEEDPHDNGDINYNVPIEELYFQPEHLGPIYDNLPIPRAYRENSYL